MGYYSIIKPFTFKSEYDPRSLCMKLAGFKYDLGQLEPNINFFYSIECIDEKKGIYTLSGDDLMDQKNYSIKYLYKFIQGVIKPGTSVDIIWTGEGYQITSECIYELEFGIVGKKEVDPINQAHCDNCGKNMGKDLCHLGLSGNYCEDCWGVEHIIKLERREEEEE